MDRKGQKMNGVVLSIGVIGIVFILGFIVWAVFGIHSQQAITGNVVAGTPAGASGAVVGPGCNQNPALGSTGVDALVTGSNVSPGTLTYIVNGKPTGTSYTAVAGDKVTTIASPAGYLPDVQTLSAVPCGTANFAFTFKKYANATETIYTDAGTAVLSNSATAGAINETQATGSKNWKVHLVSPTQQSTGKIFFVAELPSNSASNVSTLSMSCGGVPLTPTSIPSYVSTTNTNSFRNAWEIPSLDNGAISDCYLSLSLVGSKTLQGAVYTTSYAEKKFLDDDGNIKEGIYSQLGTAKFQDKYTYNFDLG